MSFMTKVMRTGWWKVSRWCNQHGSCFKYVLEWISTYPSQHLNLQLLHLSAARAWCTSSGGISPWISRPLHQSPTQVWHLHSFAGWLRAYAYSTKSRNGTGLLQRKHMIKAGTGSGLRSQWFSCGWRLSAEGTKCQQICGLLWRTTSQHMLA